MNELGRRFAEELKAVYDRVIKFCVEVEEDIAKRNAELKKNAVSFQDRQKQIDYRRAGRAACLRKRYEGMEIDTHSIAGWVFDNYHQATDGLIKVEALYYHELYYHERAGRP